MNVRFCRACRSLILTDFRYCPYCGERAPRGPDLGEALDDPFARLESAARRGLGSAGKPGSAAEEDAGMRAGTEAGTPPGGEASSLGRAMPGRGARLFAAAEESIARLEADMELILAEIGKGVG